MASRDTNIMIKPYGFLTFNIESVTIDSHYISRYGGLYYYLQMSYQLLVSQVISFHQHLQRNSSVFLITESIDSANWTRETVPPSEFLMQSDPGDASGYTPTHKDLETFFLLSR